jgi:hypothetical protein
MKKHYLLLFAAFLFFSKANAQNYNNIVNYSFNGTPVNGVKIKTTLPFTGGTQMPTIIIQGFNYGTNQVIGLQISYYIYVRADTLYYPSATITSFGTYAPPVTLANEGGKLVIFINDKPYFQRFTVSAFARGMTEDIAANYAGWTVSDETLTGTNQLLLPYSNNFTGTVKMPGSGIWNSSGNVGIGTVTPAQKLSIQDTIFPRALFSKIGIGNWYVGGDGSSGNNFAIRYNSISSYITITNTGNVGIGTSNPQYPLDVYGTIHSKQIKVDLSGTPDYVFDKDYRLPTLTETEAYINQNHHLAEIPSADEITKNGLDLGEMNKLLLKKVEELTLYMIEKDKAENQQKEINKLQAEQLQSQQAQIKMLRRQVENLIKSSNKH